jgi:hypothetical protein
MRVSKFDTIYFRVCKDTINNILATKNKSYAQDSDFLLKIK